MNHIRPIRTEADYDAALEYIAILMDKERTKVETDDLDVLTTLVENYEDRVHPVDFPDPVSAIKFRMDQLDLKPTDLAPYIGSRSKVSEVLSGKRSLTLSMIRALNKHLDIPADILIGEPKAELPATLREIDWKKFPLKQMISFGWLRSAKYSLDQHEEALRNLISSAGGAGAIQCALYRKNNASRINAKMDNYALQAWCLHILSTAREINFNTSFGSNTVNRSFLIEVAKLSKFENGPKLAQEFLYQNGIALVIAKHLPKTYLDGAAMFTTDGIPVVGMTLRYDRIDNFWFCLLHELAHIGWHLDENNSFFVDDLNLSVSGVEDDAAQESEADQIAQECLIPTDTWEKFDVFKSQKPINIISLAQDIGIHPAIVAGRVRKETGNYRLLSQFVGTGEVRKHFAEFN